MKKSQRAKVHIPSVISCFLISIVTAIALFSYDAQDPGFGKVGHSSASNWLGAFGAYLSDFLLQVFGFASFLIPIITLFWGVHLVSKRKSFALPMRAFFACLSVIAMCAMFDILGGEERICGGLIGRLVHKLLLTQIASSVGRFLLVLFVSLVALQVASGLSVRSTVAVLAQVHLAIVRIVVGLWRLFTALQTTRTKPARRPEEVVSVAVQAHPLVKESGKASNFLLPTPELLGQFKRIKSAISDKVLQARGDELLQVLKDFGVHGVIHHYHSGPVVTLYEFEPAAGIKSSRVITLADDIARVMRVVSTRIAVIPGKNSLGIEIPNDTREMVHFREVIESAEYISTPYKLPLILGKDISGAPVVADLAQMPHLLVAGTTGSGKSVAINTMILSLLFKYSPRECRLVMIDPKMLELSIYQDIPHLLAPVVTESGKAVTALKWTVKEMENRYRLMSHLNVRNLEGFNQMIERAKADGRTLTRKIQVGFDPETGKAQYEEIEIANETLPFIVVIVDEMADLMVVAGKEIESLIQRLAQMARAAGIHIIMATQRPSVDVITGVIKANLPTRISFQVTSKIDSRTILGEMGAEQLVGKGDMLYMSGGNKIRRVHGPFLSDQQVESVVTFLKSQGPAKYASEVTYEDADSSTSGSGGAELDSLYDQAVNMVLRERKASTSFIQRCFKIGYNRAALIIDQMEKNGVIGSPNHVGRREILIEK